MEVISLMNGTNMERSFTEMILDMTASLNEIIDGQFDFGDGMGGGEIYDEIEEGLPAVIDFIRQEYHQGHVIDPSIAMLRERLTNVSRMIEDYQAKNNLENNVKNPNNFGRITTISFENSKVWYGVRELCDEFVGWIERYYPSITHEQDMNGDNKRKSTAAIRLRSPELQEVRQKLVNAGLIVDDQWTGSPAQFKELVYSLNTQWGVENRGGYAWLDCARWVGYSTDKNAIKTAQNAGRVNPGETLGDIAETIRQICQKPTK